MKSRVVAAVACAMALSLCSCANQDEVAKTRAELEEARRENAELRAQLEKLGVEPARPNAKGPDAKVQAEVMKRWNAVAETMPADLTKNGFGVVKYTWGKADQIPHPTYKGGSAEAYAGFGRVLLAFLQNEENFKYLADNGFFTAELQYVFPSGQVTKMGTFAQLVESFSAPDAHGKLDDESRKALKAISDRIQASIKGQGKV
jgi:hypothetical protein